MISKVSNKIVNKNLNFKTVEAEGGRSLFKEVVHQRSH
jgi:hypothetical protein